MKISQSSLSSNPSLPYLVSCKKCRFILLFFLITTHDSHITSINDFFFFKVVQWQLQVQMSKPCVSVSVQVNFAALLLSRAFRSLQSVLVMRSVTFYVSICDATPSEKQ